MPEKIPRPPGMEPKREPPLEPNELENEGGQEFETPPQEAAGEPLSNIAPVPVDSQATAPARAGSGDVHPDLRGPLEKMLSLLTGKIEKRAKNPSFSAHEAKSAEEDHIRHFEERAKRDDI